MIAPFGDEVECGDRLLLFNGGCLCCVAGVDCDTHTASARTNRTQDKKMSEGLREARKVETKKERQISGWKL